MIQHVWVGPARPLDPSQHGAGPIIFFNSKHEEISDDATDASLVANGVPLSWQETRHVSWWAAIWLVGWQIDHVLDTTPGYGAAAIGAYCASIQYEGMCLNTLHKEWCDNLMRQAMMAVLESHGGAGATKDHVTKAMQFFGPAVNECRRLVMSDKNNGADADDAGSAVGDGDDGIDSDGFAD